MTFHAVEQFKAPPLSACEPQGQSSFPCPNCAAKRCGVINSRPSGDGIRRRRACFECHHRWTTYEVTATHSPVHLRASLERVREDIKALLTSVDLLLKEDGEQ